RVFTQRTLRVLLSSLFNFQGPMRFSPWFLACFHKPLTLAAQELLYIISFRLSSSFFKFFSNLFFAWLGIDVLFYAAHNFVFYIKHCVLSRVFLNFFKFSFPDHFALLLSRAAHK
ncbi:MAG: hypothetical protein U0P28_02020, partial [Ruminococcus sp.]